MAGAAASLLLGTGLPAWAGGASGRVAVVVDVREVPVLCAAGMEVLVAAHAQLPEYG